MSLINDPVLNIIVVGFHHKKGCQVEHCYPELVHGRPTELPAQWRHLPALALPDGSHNYLSDTIFFHLPGLTEPVHTVYAISCFRQIPLEQVVQKTEDMTRSSVQKSVCVVCRYPLFGRLAVKMELVVRAWFLQGDFSQTKLLEDAFEHLNSCPVQIDQASEDEKQKEALINALDENGKNWNVISSTVNRPIEICQEGFEELKKELVKEDSKIKKKMNGTEAVEDQVETSEPPKSNINIIQRDLGTAPDWTILMDTYEKHYKIPEDFGVSSSRPDIFLFSREIKRIVLVEPWETNKPKDHTIKINKYYDLPNELTKNGYMVNLYAVEVGERGIPAKSLYNLLKDLGLLSSTLERVSKAALAGSYQIWLGRERNPSCESLSAQRIVDTWRHKALLLFKLVLLRRRVLVYGAAAGPLSAALLALLSLLPRCVEEGLGKAANVTLSRPLSPLPVAPIEDDNQEGIEPGIEPVTEPDAFMNGDQSVDFLSPKEADNMIDEKDRVSRQSFDGAILTDDTDKDLTTAGREKCHSVGEKYKTQKSVTEAQQSPTMARDMSIDGLYNLTSQVDQTECGLPLPLFEDGYLCLPYLSLQYLDLLSDPAVQGFVVGASNVLFKQKRQLFDVLVDLNEMRIETSDLLLRRQLTLGTEDLRFADHVVRYGPSQGDAWIRDQFASYLIYLLRTSLLPEGSREIEPYNAQFMSAFKATPAYRKWVETTNSGEIEAFTNLVPLHPFAGQLSVADMKLKFAHTMSTTEGGRKVTAAVASTGRAVATTSRAVGGALSQARGALTGWWSALTTPPTPGVNTTSSLASDSSSTDEKLASDAEDATEYDNRQGEKEIEHPPDKSIEETTSNISKIRVV